MENIELTIKTQGKEYKVDTHDKEYVFHQRALGIPHTCSIKRKVKDRFLVLKLISELLAGKEVDISCWYAFGVGKDDLGKSLY